MEVEYFQGHNFADHLTLHFFVLSKYLLMASFEDEINIPIAKVLEQNSIEQLQSHQLT